MAVLNHSDELLAACTCFSLVALFLFHWLGLVDILVITECRLLTNSMNVALLEEISIVNGSFFFFFFFLTATTLNPSTEQSFNFLSPREDH